MRAGAEAEARQRAEERATFEKRLRHRAVVRISRSTLESLLNLDEDASVLGVLPSADHFAIDVVITHPRLAAMDEAQVAPILNQGFNTMIHIDETGRRWVCLDLAGVPQEGDDT